MTPMSSECCRFCMNNTVLDNIFKSDDLYKIITLYIDSQIHENDGLPPYVCMICEDKIFKFDEFKKNCLEISSQLQFMVQNSKPEINVLSGHDIQNEESSLTRLYEDGTCTDNAGQVNLKLGNTSCQLSLKHFRINETCLEAQSSIIVQKVKCLELKIEPDKQLLQNHPSTFKDEQFYGKYVNWGSDKIKTNETLVKHKQTVLDGKQYSCNLCSKQFTRSAHLIVHMRIHSGIKPYICEFCGKASTKKQDLNRHLKIHSEEKKYSCSKCHRKFKRTGDVYSHMRTHTDDRPYKCYQCHKSYKSPSALLKHKGTCMETY